MPSSNPPDRFQREIDDIIRLAERRLERESLSYRMRRTSRRLGGAMGGFSLRLPPAETLGGWALALLLISWLLSLPFVRGVPLAGLLGSLALIFGIALLTLALVTSLLRGRGQAGGGGQKMWRGERITYGNPYGESWLNRLRRLFRGRR